MKANVMKSCNGQVASHRIKRSNPSRRWLNGHVDFTLAKKIQVNLSS